VVLLLSQMGISEESKNALNFRVFLVLVLYYWSGERLALRGRGLQVKEPPLVVVGLCRGGGLGSFFYCIIIFRCCLTVL